MTDRAISDLFKLGALQEADLTKNENNISCDVTVRMDTSVSFVEVYFLLIFVLSFHVLRLTLVYRMKENEELSLKMTLNLLLVN